jgi:hypothetical protein
MASSSSSSSSSSSPAPSNDGWFIYLLFALLFFLALGAPLSIIKMPSLPVSPFPFRLSCLPRAHWRFALAIHPLPKFRIFPLCPFGHSTNQSIKLIFFLFFVQQQFHVPISLVSPSHKLTLSFNSLHFPLVCLFFEESEDGDGGKGQIFGVK